MDGSATEELQVGVWQPEVEKRFKIWEKRREPGAELPNYGKIF